MSDSSFLPVTVPRFDEDRYFEASPIAKSAIEAGNRQPPLYSAIGHILCELREFETVGTLQFPMLLGDAIHEETFLVPTTGSFRRQILDRAEALAERKLPPSASFD